MAEVGNADLQTWFDESYALSVAALCELGLPGQVIESLEGVETATLNLLEAYDAQSGLDMAFGEMVITPPVAVTGLQSAGGLIRRFENASEGSARERAFITALPWGLWTDHSRVHDADREGFKLQLGIHLSDATDKSESGLVFVGEDVATQQQHFRREAETYKANGFMLDSITIAQWLLINAQRRLAGRELLDSSGTKTRLIHYPPTSGSMGGGPPAIPTTRIVDGRIKLEASLFPNADSNQGVRRVLRVPYRSQTAASSAGLV